MSSIGSNAPDPLAHHVSLLQAAARNNERKVKELVESQTWVTESDLNALRLALQKVAIRGNVSLARFLIEKGAQVNSLRRNELSALYKAAEKGFIGFVQLLLENGAETEALDKMRRTPLFVAALNGHIAVVRTLLEANADVDARDSDGQTVLVALAAEKPPLPDKNGKPKASKWGLDMVQLLLKHGADIEAYDNTRRTAVLWASARGRLDLVRLLLSGTDAKSADIHAFNDRGKTALHLAVENYHENLVKFLLDEGGANPMARSDGGWTPLHIASEKGFEGVMALLLASGADVNSVTSSGMTALHWAAHYGHESIVRMIMNRPEALLNIKDVFGSTPMLRAAQKCHIEIVHLLSPVRDGPRLSPHARAACDSFKATIVDFWSSWSNVSKCSVYDLLYGWDEKEDKPTVPTLTKNTKAKPSFRWIHLPANNVAWAETLLTKWFIESGAREVEDFKAIEKFFSQEHRGHTAHSRFMRPFCRSTPLHASSSYQPGTPGEGGFGKPSPIPLERSTFSGGSDKDHSKSAKKGKDKSARKGSASNEFGTPSRASSSNDISKSTKSLKSVQAMGKIVEDLPDKISKICLFMPYLHYETHDRREAMAFSIKEANLWLPADEKLTPDEHLIRGYLSHKPGLHIRRTLDQFFYHGIDTSTRDEDQVVDRYCKRHFQERKLYMVDQMWLWVLSKDLIVTSFPQRWAQPKNDPLNVLDGIIEDINSKTRVPIRTVFEAALLITSRVSGVFDRHRLADENVQFLEMFESSIGHVTNQESKLFQKFNAASRTAAEWLKQHGRARRRTRSQSNSRSKSPRHNRDRSKNPNPHSDLETDDEENSHGNTTFVDDLLDIGVETKLLAECKDLRDELAMVFAVLKHQQSVLPDLAEVITDNVGGKRSALSLEVRKKSKDQLKMIETYLKDVERMDKQSESSASSLAHLLDLKQKHANAFEARFAREQADLAARQGKTLLIFTLVTIIFLPMSFIAAFFAINFDDFPSRPTTESAPGQQKDGGGLQVSYVAKYTFGIGLAISLPLIALAFSADDVSAAGRRVWTTLTRRGRRGRRSRTGGPTKWFGIGKNTSKTTHSHHRRKSSGGATGDERGGLNKQHLGQGYGGARVDSSEKIPRLSAQYYNTNTNTNNQRTSFKDPHTTVAERGVHRGLGISDHQNIPAYRTVGSGGYTGYPPRQNSLSSAGGNGYHDGGMVYRTFSRRTETSWAGGVGGERASRDLEREGGRRWNG